VLLAKKSGSVLRDGLTVALEQPGKEVLAELGVAGDAPGELAVGVHDVGDSNDTSSPPP